MAIKGLPKIEPNRRHGFTCSDDECWAHGETREIAFSSWKEAKKEVKVAKDREHAQARAAVSEHIRIATSM